MSWSAMIFAVCGTLLCDGAMWLCINNHEHIPAWMWLGAGFINLVGACALFVFFEDTVVPWWTKIVLKYFDKPYIHK
jgi:hypothetical protein